jgi:hypothetical protein
MKGRLQHWLLLLAFGFNVLALYAGIMGILSTRSAGGSTLFFSIVLIAAPILSIAVFADRGWTKSN